MTNVQKIKHKCKKCGNLMAIGQNDDGRLVWFCNKCKAQEEYLLICPQCGEENYSEVTEWCPIYGEPLIDGECITGPDRQMCCPPMCPTYKVVDVYYCNSCDTFFNFDKCIDWDDAMGYTDCRIESFDIKQVIKRYEECINDAREIHKLGFSKIALAFTVTSFEIASKELFIRYYRNWFYHFLTPGEKEDEYIIELILDEIKRLKLPQFFYSQLEDYKKELKSDHKILDRENLLNFIRFELFIDNPLKYFNYVNFNRMTDRGSFSWLYRYFFNINVNEEFQQKGNDKWKKFCRFVKHRHKIIHNYSIPIDNKYAKEGTDIADEIILYLQDQLNKIDEYVKKDLLPC